MSDDRDRSPRDEGRPTGDAPAESPDEGSPVGDDAPNSTSPADNASTASNDASATAPAPGDPKPGGSATPPTTTGGAKGPPGSNTPANGGDDKDPEEKPIVVDAWGIGAIVVLAGVIILALFLIDRGIPAPALVDPGSPVATSAQLAYYLARWGLVLTVVGFVSLLVAQVMRTFRFRARAPKLEAAGDATAAPWDKLFDAIPELIKNPVGVGMALILIAATLLIAIAVASKDDTTEPEPSASPAAEESESPSPEASASPSVSPRPSPSQ